MSEVAILHDLEARLALTAGVDIVANTVKCTMGPRGRNVAYRGELGPPKITHDGVSVARDIRLRNGFLQTGAAIVTEACRLTNTAAGDGTTTAAVLTQALTHEAQRLVAAGADPMRLRRGLAAAVLQVDQTVREQARPITNRRETAWVAGLAAHDTDLGEIIAGIFDRYGLGAAVTVELGQGLSTEARTVEGMRLERGLASRQLATAGAGMRAELEDCDVLVTDRELGGVGPMLPFLEDYVAGGGQRLLVVAKTIGGETLATLVENHRLGRMSVIAVRAPVFGERQRAMLEDLAIFTGATLVAHESGDPWGSVPVSVLGRAARVRSDSTETLILGGAGEPQAVADRAELLWVYRDRAKNQFDREKLEERIRIFPERFLRFTSPRRRMPSARKRGNAWRTPWPPPVRPWRRASWPAAGLRWPAPRGTSPRRPKCTRTRPSAGAWSGARWRLRWRRSPATPASRAPSWPMPWRRLIRRGRLT